VLANLALSKERAPSGKDPNATSKSNVNKVLDSKMVGKRIKYQVKWWGRMGLISGPSSNTLTKNLPTPGARLMGVDDDGLAPLGVGSKHQRKPVLPIFF
jgi:hypothetical protein